MVRGGPGGGGVERAGQSRGEGGRGGRGDLVASKHRSTGTPPSPETPPQFESIVALAVASQIEPHGVAHPPASRVTVKMWSAPPLVVGNRQG